MNIPPFQAQHTTLGFVGLGHMGSRIVHRLLGTGYKVQVYDRWREQADALRKDGATVAASVAELAPQCNVILSCLTDDAAVRSVYTGPDGILQHAKPGTVVLEMSTVSPNTSRELADLATGVGVRVLDAAISGSTPAAERGELILFVGGNPDLFEAAKPIFQAYSRKAFHLGPSGAGETMKLVVNAILGVGMQAIAEASAFGEKAGLDRKVLLDVLSQTAVIAPAHMGKLSRAAIDEFSPQFPLRLMNKDFRLILETAHAANAPMPASEASYQINTAALSAEPEEVDFSVVMKYVQRISGDSQPAAASGRSARATD